MDPKLCLSDPGDRPRPGLLLIFGVLVWNPHLPFRGRSSVTTGLNRPISARFGTLSRSAYWSSLSPFCVASLAKIKHFLGAKGEISS
jgi:hypothetical protein